MRVAKNPIRNLGIIASVRGSVVDIRFDVLFEVISGFKALIGPGQ